MSEVLQSWREVIKPRREVQIGKFHSEDFAADLVQSVQGNASDDYTQPERFFKMTEITAGMRGLMMDALRRVTGGDGASVIQIKTAFGGGKTHSMLALYHLMHGGFNAWSVPAVKDMLEELGLAGLPQVNIAVIGGTFEGVSTSRFVRGIETHTLWGNIAAQLGGYDYVRESDIDKRAPGYGALMNMFDKCGPCLVLIDELAAYGKKIYTKDADRPSDESFINFQTFLQELTEAAKFSKNSLVVVAMPDSKLSVGDEEGMEVLRIIDHVFERIESIWKPVTALEGFKIVKRRLFEAVDDDSAVERTAQAFSEMYSGNSADFPAEARELRYKERIIECYPIHPEVFDRLYGEWSTLENFQRTRGVLQLLANVVHDLWENGDTSPLIMPGSIAYAGKKASEIGHYISQDESWSPIMDMEIDGKDSLPRQLDAHYKREDSAAMRLARTILLGSAPSTKAQNVRGVEKERVFLGTVLAGENISVFRDALGNLRDTLSYLYVGESGGRFWFDTRPTLRRTVKNRSAQKTDEDIESEIRRRLRKSGRGKFESIHVWPESDEVLDTQTMRLVILPPKAGEKDAEEILKSCGHNQRKNRNMVLFVEADALKREELTDTVRVYLGWKSVDEDHGNLNLSEEQKEEVKRSCADYNRKVDDAISAAWSLVLIPQCPDGKNVDAFTWKRERMSSGGELSDRVVYALTAEELSQHLNPYSLRTDLDGILWKSSQDIEIKRLWEMLCEYCYLQRVLNRSVLVDAITAGMSEGKYFALATGKSDGQYEGLQLNAPHEVDMTALLVKREIAEKQIPPVKPEPTKEKAPKIGTDTPTHTEPETPKLKRKFSASIPLHNNPNPVELVKKIYNEVIRELQRIPGARLDIQLEIEMLDSDGVLENVQTDIESNCENLKINDYCNFHN